LKSLLGSSEEVADVTITYLQLFNQIYKDRKEVMISNRMFNDGMLIERLMKTFDRISNENLDADLSSRNVQLQVACEATHTLGLLAREGIGLTRHRGLFLLILIIFNTAIIHPIILLLKLYHNNTILIVIKSFKIFFNISCRDRFF
jgi:hypothetical protein